MAIDINRLSLNSDGAFRTTIQRRIPQTRNNTSTKKKKQYNNIVNSLSILIFFMYAIASGIVKKIQTSTLRVASGSEMDLDVSWRT